MNKGQTSSKKPTYFLAVWVMLLSFLSGYINVVSLQLFLVPSSHLTGSLTKTVETLQAGEYTLTLFYLSIIFSFFLGGVFSGAVFAKKTFHPRQRYGMLIFIYGLVLLFLSNILFETRWVIIVLAFLMGSQNGLFIFYKGMLVRTTHFTGYLTDAGVLIGRGLRGKRIDWWKIRFYLFSMVLFGLGGFFSASIYTNSREWIMIVGSLCYWVVGSYYMVFRHYFVKEDKK